MDGFRRGIYKNIDGIQGPLSLAYDGTNSVRSVATATWSQARLEGDITQSSIYTVGAYLNGLYLVHRAYFGFNTTEITSAIVGGIQINISFNNLLGPTNFALVRTVVNHPATYAWGIGDFTDSVGGVLHSNTVSVGPGATGVLNIPFNATGISYINSTNDATFVLVQVNNDHLDVAPLASANQVIQGLNTNVKLYYS